jgi:hypothetical protein
MMGSAIAHQIMLIAASQANASGPTPVKSSLEPPSIFPGWDAPAVSRFAVQR